MTAENSYITLAKFRDQMLAGGNSSTDTSNDTLFSDVIEQASRDIDGYCGRHFYPLFDTLEFDVPDDGVLWFWSYDLLEATTVTNGSSGAMSASDYSVIPRNQSPTAALKLVPSSGTFWETDTNSDALNAISVAGFWGYREYYTREGWASQGTITAALAADSSLAVVSVENSFSAGEIMRIDNEMMLVTASDTAGATITRAWNGTTAALHDSGATVKKWVIDRRVVKATAIQAQRLWKRKDAPFGVAGIGTLGQVININDVDPDVERLLGHLVRSV